MQYFNQIQSDKAKKLSLTDFAKRFIPWTIALQLLVWQIHQTPAIADVIQNGLANIASELYRTFSDGIVVNKNLLIHSATGRYVIVDAQCTGLALIATLLAAIFSLSHSLINKTVMTLCAVVLIEIENIIRITHLFYEVKEPVNHFEIYHLYVWQLVNFVFALAIFFVLNNYFNKKEQGFDNNNKKPINPS